MSNNNYPKRFEILQNDGETLQFRVDKLANGLVECFVRHCINDIDYIGIDETQVWEQSFSEKSKISIVDTTNLVKNKPYGKGGNAHSDIFTPGIASFIWNCISNLENN
jgi:hypothetical protein